MLLSTEIVRADGKVFTAVAGTSASVPDQRALLRFSDGIETLVVETSFVGPGTNFAWVLPLPSKPDIEAVSSKFFDKLNFSFQPKLVDAAAPWWFLFSLLGLIFVFGSKRVGCAGCLGSGGILMVLSLLLIELAGSRGGPGCAQSATHPTTSAVRILAQNTVGVYETTVIQSADGNALLHWLNKNGYHIPGSALPVITSYAKQNWVFVAARVARENNRATERDQLHPLAFTFRSATAIYPLQLTGVENEKCDIELFIFGPDRAEVDRFEVVHCGKPFSTTNQIYNAPSPGEYRLHVPEVVRAAMPSSVVTKLRGKLKSKDMKRDAVIRWVPFNPAVLVMYSDRAMWSIFLNWFLGITLTGAMLFRLVSKKLKPSAEGYFGLGVLAVALICASLRTVPLETTPVKIVHRGFRGDSYHWGYLNTAVSNYSAFRTNAVSFGFEELTNAFNLITESYQHPRNAFTRSAISNSPTPGNLTLETNGSEIQVFWYDVESVPHLVRTFTNRVVARKAGDQ